MKVYVFGNEDEKADSLAITVARKIKGADFEFVAPNADLPFAGDKRVVIMDVVRGLKRPELLSGDTVNKLIVDRSLTVHDYDLGFQLKYLLKLEKLGSLTIIGIPQTGKIDYRRIQSILRKLVAQDIQGS
jgi:hypothetical protein